MLVWFPQIKACVSEQAFSLLPHMCLLWSLRIQTGENNFCNCWLNWQAWISRQHLRVLSCQVVPRVLVAPESHYSQEWHHTCLSFPSHCVNSHSPLPLVSATLTVYVGWGGGGEHLQPLGYVTRKLLRVCVCLFVDSVGTTHPRMVPSQRGVRGPSGVFSVQGPWGCGRGRGRRISQRAKDEIAYWNWK